MIMRNTTMMLMIVCSKTSLFFYLIYFICRWLRVIIALALKKITLKCKLATLQIEADDIIVKTTSS